MSGGDPALEKISILLNTLQGGFGSAGREPMRCCAALGLTEE